MRKGAMLLMYRSTRFLGHVASSLLHRMLDALEWGRLHARSQDCTHRLSHHAATYLTGALPA